jgi:hypothetical protein
MAIVLNMLSLDNPAKVNCQVSPCLTSGSVWFNCDPQGPVYYEQRKHLVYMTRVQHGDLIPHHLLSSYFPTLPSVPLHC